ncbi:phosphate ABC transporter, periplasmic phosphate-binding protein PstS [Pseudanabaena sp. lw0831]|uniref:phosphate ABC transporter substrate-binding protein PstS n=1 Tax=Pseudanabaena sp. lw0831 TaxID=1357935 RepID=UPI0019167D1D|nr:phosphate ABC transporter substrate-binding protein PstS [Pseudanabaena sp. lw0831]GBO53992.1 phosphate ABC transporter, periplasmic phosphate-binding protein PstS [Pseudanabaena sp. lw0831]
MSAIPLAIALKACQGKPPDPKETNTQAPESKPSAIATAISLYGAGATFPSFLYLRWFKEYNTKNPNVQISYQPVGSAAGIQQFLSGTVDFGASEVPPTDKEISQVNRGVVLIPSVAGSVAVVYNIPGVKTGLKLSRQVLPAIFLGKIKKWNDPAIAALNPSVTLPDLPITVVHRSDGSGTTAAFTAHLSAISPEWQSAVGTGLNVSWKTGVGIKDNSGISAQIQQGEGVIGYVEYAFAKQLKLATAALENRMGQFALPTEDATAKAIATIKLSDDFRGSVADPETNDAYPIVTYSWVLAYKQYDDPKQAQALKDVLRWGLTQGQAMGSELGYVPLPDMIVKKAIAELDKIGN